MVIKMDPEKNEIRALFDLVDFAGRRVLEIGCGDGRLTWRYAESAAQVTGVDASSDAISRAQKNVPERLRDRVAFHHVAFEKFAAATAPSQYDLAILSWSL